MKTTISYRDWTISLQDGDRTLRSALDTLDQVAATQGDIPFIVQFMENPRYGFPWFRFFHGFCDLTAHDAIHCVLARGLLPKDEAFVIGYTMGSSKKINSFNAWVFTFIAKYFYPPNYRFDDECIQVFKHAWKLAYISECKPLADFDYDKMMDMKLKDIRKEIGVEEHLLEAYYQVEHDRYPDSRESQRLCV